MVPTGVWPTDLISKQQFSVAVRENDGAYEIREKDAEQPAVRSCVAAQLNDSWIRSSEYPAHRVAHSNFHDELGNGEQLSVVFTELPGRPNLKYILRLYDDLSFGDTEVQVQDDTPNTVTVQAIRNLAALGEPD
jgi:hypothetical protein